MEKRSTFSALYSMKQWSVGWKSVPGGRARALLGSWRWSWRKKNMEDATRPLQKQNELVVITQPIWKSISQINSPGRGEKNKIKKLSCHHLCRKRLGPLRAERCGNSPQLLHGIDPQLKVIVPGRWDPAKSPSDSGPRATAVWKMQNILWLQILNLSISSS